MLATEEIAPITGTVISVELFINNILLLSPLADDTPYGAKLSIEPYITSAKS